MPLCAVVFSCALLVACLLCLPGSEAVAAAKSLTEQIQEEQSKAGERRASLQRLSAEERRLNTDLALAEDRILALEDSLAAQEKTLVDLARSDADLRARHALLTVEQERTEQALSDIMLALWEIQSRREGVGGRDLPDWHVTDREHAWSLELLAALREHRAVLVNQTTQLADIMHKREAVGREAEAKLAALGREKEELLQARVAYGQRLQELRRQRQDTEAELESILALVTSLNLRIKESGIQTPIDKAKGSLPLPAAGSIKQRFNVSANPPFRGISVSVKENDPVRAVHWGKVVHNDILRGKGRVVIIMHGDEYYTLYAYLADSPLQVGQDVARQEVIGTAGFVPDLKGPGVYFELRFHQKAINPEDWFSKK